MSECGGCGTSLPESANYCPNCGAPQNETAADRLRAYVDRKVRERGGERDATDGDGTLARRVSYVVGYGSVVGGLTVLPDPAAACFLLAGLVVLPPVRRVAGRRLAGRPLSGRVAGVAFLALLVAGVAGLRFA